MMNITLLQHGNGRPGNKVSVFHSVHLRCSKKGILIIAANHIARIAIQWRFRIGIGQES